MHISRHDTSNYGKLRVVRRRNLVAEMGSAERMAGAGCTGYQ
jgi:hypothetical protein